MKPNAVNPTILFSALNLPRVDPERQLNRPHARWVAENRRTPASRDGVIAFDET